MCYSLYFEILNLTLSFVSYVIFLQELRSSNYNADRILQSSGISISPEFMQVEGRVLSAPRVRLVCQFWILSFHLYYYFLDVCPFYHLSFVAVKSGQWE